MNKIKQLLKEKGMTQKDLAAKLGMSEVAVSNIVKNNSSTKETLQKIADILETVLQVLLHHRDNYLHFFYNHQYFVLYL